MASLTAIRAGRRGVRSRRRTPPEAAGSFASRASRSASAACGSSRTSPSHVPPGGIIGRDRAERRGQDDADQRDVRHAVEPSAGRIAPRRARTSPASRSTPSAASAWCAASSRPTPSAAPASRRTSYRALRFSGSRRDDLGIDALLEEFGLSRHLARARATSCPTACRRCWAWSWCWRPDPRFLLLDEPAAGLERRERTQVDRFVAPRPQDASAAASSSSSTTWTWCAGSARTSSCWRPGGCSPKGAPAEVLSRQDVIDAYLGAGEE